MVSGTSVKLIFFGLIALAVFLEVVGDILFKKWSIDGRNILLIAGLAIYFAGTAFWAISLKYEYLSKAISIFTVLNLIAIVLAGVFIFEEKLSLINRIGIAAGILSIVLIEL